MSPFASKGLDAIRTPVPIWEMAVAAVFRHVLLSGHERGAQALLWLDFLLCFQGLILVACAKTKELRPVYTVLQRAAPVTTNVLRRSYGLSHRWLRRS